LEHPRIAASAIATAMAKNGRMASHGTDAEVDAAAAVFVSTNPDHPQYSGEQTAATRFS
jgi:hypothetical protein